MAEDNDKITTSSIFANALASTKATVAAPDDEPSRGVLVCEGCGAPRIDGDASLICSYCGSAVAPVKPEPK